MIEQIQAISFYRIALAKMEEKGALLILSPETYFFKLGHKSQRAWFWRHWTSASEGQWTLRGENPQDESYHLPRWLLGGNLGKPGGAQTSPWVEEIEMVVWKGQGNWSLQDRVLVGTEMHRAESSRGGTCAARSFENTTWGWGKDTCKGTRSRAHPGPASQKGNLGAHKSSGWVERVKSTLNWMLLWSCLSMTPKDQTISKNLRLRKFFLHHLLGNFFFLCHISFRCRAKWVSYA